MSVQKESDKKTPLDEVYDDYTAEAKASKNDVKEVSLLTKHSVTFTDDYGDYKKGFVLADISRVAADVYLKTGKAKENK